MEGCAKRDKKKNDGKRTHGSRVPLDPNFGCVWDPKSTRTVNLSSKDCRWVSSVLPLTHRLAEHEGVNIIVYFRSCFARDEAPGNRGKLVTLPLVERLLLSFRDFAFVQ